MRMEGESPLRVDARHNPDTLYHIIMNHVIIQRITDDFFRWQGGKKIDFQSFDVLFNRLHTHTRMTRR